MHIKNGHIADTNRININGVFPHLAVIAGHVPRTEIGIGALMPWADRLWFITYPSSGSGSGKGTGLFSIDENMNIARHPESVVGTYANRIIHSATNQLIMGPHLIGMEGDIRTIEPLIPHRLTATMTHLEDPKNKVYFLTMEALFFEVDLNTLEVKQLFDLRKELDMQRPHFKDAYTGHGRVVVANNTYDERDFNGKPTQGRLAEWDGKEWSIIETCQFNAVTGRTSIGTAIFAIGADNASAILKVLVAEDWETYRLPKATHTQDHTVTTEWPRIREIESERWLINCSGMFYELPAMQYGGKVWGVRPISTHLRIIGDFCSWRGLLVLAGDQTTPIGDSNLFVGQPQANLWFGKSDDLWQFGKPKGWGGPWRNETVKANEASDPYLMTGFDRKVLHLRHDADQTANFTVEIDFLGDQTWDTYSVISVPPNGYVHHEFPDGFSAHWVRVTVDKACAATAYFHYT
ncbi:hypothetical protein ACFL6S_11045 [Candidatus Poribacteria bacterium]